MYLSHSDKIPSKELWEEGKKAGFGSRSEVRGYCPSGWEGIERPTVAIVQGWDLIYLVQSGSEGALLAFSVLPSLFSPRPPPMGQCHPHSR